MVSQDEYFWKKVASTFVLSESVAVLESISILRLHAIAWKTSKKGT